jgi:hypothetical protein
MPLSKILPTRRSSRRMLPLQLLANWCRLLHWHHCHYCVRCRRCGNCHGRLNFVGMLQRSIECSKSSIPAPLCIRMLQTNYNYVIWMMPLSLVLGMQNVVLCHCRSIWCCNWCGKKKSDPKQLAITRQIKIKFSFVHFSTGFQYKSYSISHLGLS